MIITSINANRFPKLGTPLATMAIILGDLQDEYKDPTLGLLLSQASIERLGGQVHK